MTQWVPYLYIMAFAVCGAGNCNSQLTATRAQTSSLQDFSEIGKGLKRPCGKGLRRPTPQEKPESKKKSQKTLFNPLTN